jgi:hypothetical protein
MLQIGDKLNPELRIITSTFSKILYKGESFLLYSQNTAMNNIIISSGIPRGGLRVSNPPPPEIQKF